MKGTREPSLIKIQVKKVKLLSIIQSVVIKLQVHSSIQARDI